MYQVVIFPNGDLRRTAIAKPAIRNLYYANKIRRDAEAKGHEATITVRGGRNHGKAVA